MKVVFHGVRGTSVVTRPEFARFGGDTTCVAVHGEGGELIVLDAGTGIMNVSRWMDANPGSRSLLLLMTHYHLDHVMGLPSFTQLYNKEWNIEIAAPVRSGFAVEDVVHRVVAKPFWPLQVETMGARIRFTNLPGSQSRESFPYGGLRVQWCPLHHSEGCTAYRIDEPATGGSFVLATDVEWSAATEAEKNAFRQLCSTPSPPVLLVFDGQFRAENFETFRGWGHSTVEECVEVARAVKARELVITHHAPRSDDERLDSYERDAARVLAGTRLARQGMEIRVPA